MTYSLPPAITASSGFDALSQGVEAFWASSTTPPAQEYATATIRYALNNIYNAVHSPNPGNRYHMAQAAYLSGLALNITRTTIPHALGYHLTKFYGIPHGHAVALTVPYCFRLNLDPALPVNTPMGREGHLENMRKLMLLLGQENGEDCFVFWRNLLAACGLAPTLRDVGMDSEDKVRAFVASMNMERMKNHPVAIPTETLIQEFLKEERNGR
jgi:alcohol dehydrogenase class IV